MQYPILPKKKDREINTFYRFQDEIRFWNGKSLLCKCKHYIYRCKNCSPEGYQAYLERERIYREKNPEAVRDRQRIYREKNPEAQRDRQKRYRENNLEAVRDREKRYRENNREAVRERVRRHYKKHPESLRCNDGCIAFLHSDTDFIPCIKKKYGSKDIRVCYNCAKVDIINESDPEKKKEKQKYYNCFYGERCDFLFRIELAIFLYLNEIDIIKYLNDNFLQIHDTDIATIIGKNKSMTAKKPDKCYVLQFENHDGLFLLHFEIDEKYEQFNNHEKNMNRLLQIRERLQKHYDEKVYSYVFRINTKDSEDLVRRKKYDSNDAYQMTEDGKNYLENKFIPCLQKILQNEEIIENDKNIIVYEFNVKDEEEMKNWYREENPDFENVFDYVKFV